MEQKIQILKNTLVEIKQNLANLKEKSDAIGKIIDAGEIISKDAVGELKAILENYQQLELRLHEIGKDLDLNFGTKLEDIYETITSYEQKFRYDRIKEIIIDYFRLNSETAEIKSSLEHSKLMLIEKCASSIELLEKDIEPYELVVSTVKESSELPIEKYASIINDIDFTIALATFKGGLLFFDDSIDVSQYTISLPLTYRKTKTDENTKATKGSSEVNSKSVELSQFIMPRRWSNFGGYVSDVKVSITEITESPSLEEIKTLEKENKDSLIVLWNAANEKLIPVETTEHTTSRIFSHETIELLRNYGLLTDITIADINGSKHFLTLSAKGWMCFTNSYIKNYLYNREVPLSIPNTLCISSEDWTPLFASRTALVHDCCRKRNQNYVLWKGKPSEIVFAIPTNQAEIMMIAGLLQEYAEENDLNEMANNLNLLENDSIILIVVRQHNDIAVLANELNALVSRRIKVFFAAADKRFAVFNSDGISAELPKMSTIDYSGDDTTALKEPPHNDHSEKFNAKHLTAVNKVKTNSPSASKFKKEILDLLKRFSEVRTILPLFTHLGILELDQIFRFGVCLECFSDDVVTKRKVFDAIDLLCTKGLLAHYQYGQEDKTINVYGLASYCHGSMRKKEIDSMTIWTLKRGNRAISCEQTFSFDEIVNTVNANAALLEYLDVAKTQFSKPDYDLIKKSINWVDNYYHVACFLGEEIVPCCVFFEGLNAQRIHCDNIILTSDYSKNIKLDFSKFSNVFVTANGRISLLGEEPQNDGIFTSREDATTEENPENTIVEIENMQSEDAPESYTGNENTAALTSLSDQYSCEVPSDEEFCRKVFAILNSPVNTERELFSHVSNALLLARTAGFIKNYKNSERLSRRLQFATNVFFDDKYSYSSNDLADAFAVVEQDEQAITLAAY